MERKAGRVDKSIFMADNDFRPIRFVILAGMVLPEWRLSHVPIPPFTLGDGAVFLVAGIC